MVEVGVCVWGGGGGGMGAGASASFKGSQRSPSAYIVVKHIQLTLVISTSLISNNRLSRSENLVPA